MKILKFFNKLCALAICTLISGCDNENSNVFIYEKEITDANKYIEIQLHSSEYTDSELKIKFKKLFLEPNISPKYLKVRCYDKDFKEIKQDSNVSLKDNVLVIKNTKARDISGIFLNINEAKFAIRYLDSKSYSILSYLFASDEGEHEFGDLDTYYSEQEKKQQQEEINQRLAHSNQAFDYIMGLWESKDKTLRFETTVSEQYPGHRKLIFSEYDQESATYKQISYIFSNSAYFDYDSYTKEIILISISTGNMTAPLMFNLNTQDGTLTSQMYEDKPMHKITE